MEKYEVKGVNSKKISEIVTQLLLIKNLPTHYKFVRKNLKGKLLSKRVKQSPYLMLVDLMEKHPELNDRIAMEQDRKVTYREMRKEIDNLANFFHHVLGCEKGENISICAGSPIEGIEAFFAMNKVGLVNARIFNGSKREKLNQYIINFNSKTILVDDNNIDELSESLENTKIENVVLLNLISQEKREAFEKKHPNIKLYSWNKVQKGYVWYRDAEVEVSRNDMASVLYTSGSSGESKPISITNEVYINMPEIVITTTSMPTCDNEKAIGVVSHEYPYAAINSTIMVLLMGKTLVMPKNNENSGIDFDDLLSSKPEKIQAIPNFYKLLEAAKINGDLKLDDASFLQTIVSGGETFLTEEKIETLGFLNSLNANPLLIDGFGFGELGSATALKFGLSDYFLLMNGIRAKAVDPETGDDLKSGEQGILCLTSPSIASGYYNNEEATEKALIKDKNGTTWFKSDTYGSVHGIGNRLVKLGGRIREYFITGDGKGNFVKVYAGNVENVIMSTGILEDCIVVPSDAKGLPTPVAYVVLKDDCKYTEEEAKLIISEACKSLESFAQPSMINVEATLKRTNALKKDYTYYKNLQLEKANSDVKTLQ